MKIEKEKRIPFPSMCWFMLFDFSGIVFLSKEKKKKRKNKKGGDKEGKIPDCQIDVPRGTGCPPVAHTQEK